MDVWLVHFQRSDSQHRAGSRLALTEFVVPRVRRAEKGRAKVLELGTKAVNYWLVLAGAGIEKSSKPSQLSEPQSLPWPLSRFGCEIEGSSGI